MAAVSYAARGRADLALMGRVLLAVAWVVVAGWLGGCAHVSTPGAPWVEDFPRVEVPALPDLDPEDPAPMGLNAGEAAPFAGVLLATPEAMRARLAGEQRDVLVDALDLAYRGRAEDRAAAEVVLTAREEQLRQARRAQGRWFVVGVGAGGGAVLAVLLAVLLAR